MTENDGRLEVRGRRGDGYPRLMLLFCWVGGWVTGWPGWVAEWLSGWLGSLGGWLGG